MVRKIILKNRDEWLENRQRIGGSDASSILGQNKYRSNIDLWEIKVGNRKGEDISDKPYVKYGIEAEKHLRELFRLDFPQYKLEYEENNIWVNDKYPFAHASLDGWLTDEKGRKGIWECKTTNILNSMQKEEWNGEIPNNYYVQILHYLLVTEFDFVVLKAQLKWNIDGDVFCQTKHYFIEREEVKEDIEFLKMQEELFWECVVNKRKPPLLLPSIGVKND